VEDGPLTDEGPPVSEREAVGALFAGDIGSYRNPASHRTVEISDPVEAGEDANSRQSSAAYSGWG